MLTYVHQFYFHHIERVVQSKSHFMFQKIIHYVLFCFIYSCNKEFQLCHLTSNQINIFRHNGTSEKGSVLSYRCNSRECRIQVFPNHYRTDEACISNSQSFHNTSFYYYGGDSAYEKGMLNQFALLFR